MERLRLLPFLVLVAAVALLSIREWILLLARRKTLEGIHRLLLNTARNGLLEGRWVER